MGSKTDIAWTDATWSPLRARVKADAAEIATAKGYTSLVQIAEKMAGHAGPHCERVSHGCDNCYSDTNNNRCLPANGTGLPFDRRSRDLVEPFVDEKILLQPLKWQKPQRIFVENQSDLFGEWNSDEMIDRVFAVMALCPQHTFQVLTKRPERMHEYISARENSMSVYRFAMGTHILTGRNGVFGEGHKFPLPNVWLGVSVEDEPTARKRIVELLQTPAAKRFVSYEPALGPVDFTRIEFRRATWYNALEDHDGWGLLGAAHQKLDWIIVGGESGPGARPFDIAWARQTVRQCREAGVACFTKQLGAKPFDSSMVDILGSDQKVHYRRPVGHPMIAEVAAGAERTGYSCRPSLMKLKDRKGGDPTEWPEDLRVREFPA